MGHEAEGLRLGRGSDEVSPGGLPECLFIRERRQGSSWEAAGVAGGHWTGPIDVKACG